MASHIGLCFVHFSVPAGWVIILVFSEWTVDRVYLGVLIYVFCELVFQEAEIRHPEEISLNLQA